MLVDEQHRDKAKGIPYMDLNEPHIFNKDIKPVKKHSRKFNASIASARVQL